MMTRQSMFSENIRAPRFLTPNAPAPLGFADR